MNYQPHRVSQVCQSNSPTLIASVVKVIQRTIKIHSSDVHFIFLLQIKNLLHNQNEGLNSRHPCSLPHRNHDRGSIPVSCCNSNIGEEGANILYHVRLTGT